MKLLRKIKEYFKSKFIQNEWKDITTAPKDGSIIEIQNNWTLAPWYTLSIWNNDCESWQNLENGKVINSFHINGGHLKWREFKGNILRYKDPTNGEQFKPNYAFNIWKRNRNKVWIRGIL